ncbi:MAG: hypothetical protein HKP61_18005 [Dactylosporangium sp.]|nr:hypothetical protein [Dactylosporangium sp.]NNJ62792.1 hypothetical protein [Dactylosporangium sp.]
MNTNQRPFRRDSEVLLARLDAYLITVRSGHPLRVGGVDLPQAERVAAGLRTLVLDTAHASASDRARVRAAVHCFVTRGVITRVTGGRFGVHGRARLRVLTGGRPERRVIVRLSGTPTTVVNALLRELGRPDLVVPPDPVSAV